MCYEAPRLLAVILLEENTELLHKYLDTTSLHMVVHESKREFSQSEIRIDLREFWSA